MLITKLSLTHKQALAKEFRCFIEPDKAQTTRILKENELRKFLSSKGYSMYGISDVKIVLKTNYNSKTTSRILSKVQRAVVFDTCLCNLSIEEIKELVLKSDYNFIITTAVYKEIIKLATLEDETHTNKSIQTAREILSFILEDAESNYFTIINIPSSSYVDNQLLSYCKENNYILYTHDYRLGLRAKCRNIETKIFKDFDSSEVSTYVPNPAGKNIILSKDVINCTNLNNILKAATEMKANKFILTDTFVDYIEIMKDKLYIADWIRFFVADDSDNYLSFSQYSHNNNLRDFVTDNNAIIFSADLVNCMKYKISFIPYKFIDFSSNKKFLNNAKFNVSKDESHSAATTAKTHDNQTNSSNISVWEVNKSDSEKTNEKLKNSSTPNATQSFTTNTVANDTAIIPHYKPKYHSLSLTDLRNNEAMFVINQSGEEVTPSFKNGFNIIPGYRVIYIWKNDSKKNLKITVYNVLNHHHSRYSSVLFASYFEKSDLSEIPTEYHSYINRSFL